jgi:hypothetical protein
MATIASVALAWLLMFYLHMALGEPSKPTPTMKHLHFHISMGPAAPVTSPLSCLVACAAGAFLGPMASARLVSRRRSDQHSCVDACGPFLPAAENSSAVALSDVALVVNDGSLACELSILKQLHRANSSGALLALSFFTPNRTAHELCERLEAHLTSVAFWRSDVTQQLRLDAEATVAYQEAAKVKQRTGHSRRSASSRAASALAPHFVPLDEVNARLDDLALRFGPYLVRPFELPRRTHHNNSIRGVCIGGRGGYGFADGGCKTDVISILVVGAHHAREWISAAVTLASLEEVAEAIFVEGTAAADTKNFSRVHSYWRPAANSTRAAQWRALSLFSAYAYDGTDTMNERQPVLELCGIPVMNPDGYDYTFEVDDSAGSPGGHRKRMWRKNRRPCAANEGHQGSLGSAVGTDLNRNYFIDWNDNGGSSQDCSSDQYRGPAPYSEPEVLGLMEWLQAEDAKRKKTSQCGVQPLALTDESPQTRLPSPQDRNWTWLQGFISYHSYGNDILFPLGYSNSIYGRNEPLLMRIGNLMKTAIMRTSGAAYDVLKASGSYPVSGDTVDDVHVSFGSIPGYTLEVRPSESECCGFVLPVDKIEVTVVENMAALLELATYVLAANRQLAQMPTHSDVDDDNRDNNRARQHLDWANHNFSLAIYSELQEIRDRRAAGMLACPTLAEYVNLPFDDSLWAYDEDNSASGSSGSSSGEDEDENDRKGSARSSKKWVRQSGPSDGSWRPSQAAYSRTESHVVLATLPLWGNGNIHSDSASDFLQSLIGSAVGSRSLQVRVLATVPSAFEQSLRVAFQLVRSQPFAAADDDHDDDVCIMEQVVSFLASKLDQPNIVFLSMEETVALQQRTTRS